MDNKNLADYLHELVRKRNLEQVQNQELNNWTKVDEQSWQDRTNEIYKTAEELEYNSCSRECTQLTIDEAISHANEMANRDDTACSKQHKQLTDWLSELKDLKSKYAYLVDDFDNYKKRVAKTKSYAYDKAFQDVILHILSVYDDMERLYKEVQERSTYGIDDGVHIDIGPINSGFEMIFENFEKTLVNLGCEKISVAYGDEFDVNIMEAVSVVDTRPDEGYRENEVYNIVQSGWKYKDKILRPTKVIVSK